MKAIVVRKISDGSLVCFGQENGMYDPNHDPSTTVKTVEQSYEAVITEWASRPVVLPEREVAKNALKNVKSLTELLAVLEQLL